MTWCSMVQVVGLEPTISPLPMGQTPWLHVLGRAKGHHPVQHNPSSDVSYCVTDTSLTHKYTSPQGNNEMMTGEFMISNIVSQKITQEWKQTITAIDAMIAVGNCLKDRAASGAIGHIDDVVSTLMDQRKALELMIEDEANSQLRVVK